MTDGKYKGLGRFTKSQFPAHFAESQSRLIEFIQAYYDWMSQDGETQADIDQLRDYLSVQTAPQEFVDILFEDLLPSIPRNVVVDKSLLAQNIVDFYKARGSERSIEFLFKILYGEDISVYYPKENILRTSDGIWQRKKFIKVQIIDENIEQLLSRKIYGLRSRASAVVESVRIFNSASYDVAELEVSQVLGTFIPDEVLETNDSFDKIYSRVLGQVGTATVSSAGSGYLTGEAIRAIGGDGEDFLAVIDSVGINGEVISVNIVDTGVGFTTHPPIADLSTTSGTGAVITFGIVGMFNSPGRYVDDRGQPSGLSRLQDGYFYQDYSYVIKSSHSISEWKDIVKNTVHPAGTAVFGEKTTEIAVIDTYFDVYDSYTLVYPLFRELESGETRLLESGGPRTSEIHYII